MRQIGIDTKVKKEGPVENEYNNKLTPVKPEKKSFWLFVGVIFLLTSIILSYVVATILLSPEAKILNRLKLTFTEWGQDEMSVIPQIDLLPRQIDGVLVPSGKENIWPLAIMIDNHPSARPPSALSRANLVFAAEAEGGITRFLAFFADGEKYQEIGPIRSARPYFCDWAQELSALYVHVGGSPEALAKIKKENIFHVNEFYNEDLFWRSRRFEPPHNVYSSTEKLNGYIMDNESGQPIYFSWLFKEDAPSEESEVISRINIGNLDENFQIAWEYNQETNDYIRYQANNIHTDFDGRIIRAKNVVIQKTKSQVTDDDLRLKIYNIGEGEAVICQDGNCYDSKWKKRNSASRTRYYDEMELEVEFNRGLTWVEVVSPDREIEF